MPQITDAHASPSGEWTVVVTENELMILDGANVDRASLRVPLLPYESVVMVEWTTGRNVTRWNSEVARVRRLPE